ncbi:response regulator transcription factor [Burkholderia cepacia]|uniref:response regulator transcription factor n=1 Tax=Burkholderia cepacia TaxID=292 RepID=UPI00158DC890|nr:response regulator transcription factor [Burkholderia cepacia]
MIDGNAANASLISRILRVGGHEAEVANGDVQALRIIAEVNFDLIVMGWIGVFASGADAIRQIHRIAGFNIAIFVLTNGFLEQHISDSLNAGADDCMANPIREGEFLARINVLKRRSNLGGMRRVMRFGEYIVDFSRRKIIIHGEQALTTAKELEVSLILFDNFGKVVSRNHLVEKIWGRGEDVLSRSLDTHVYRAKKKLSIGVENGVVLKTVYAIGYKLDLV